jgi:altronate hydrolase
MVDVIDYGAPVPRRGLSVMDTPGFDPASVTGKVAGGCNLVLFTTGRGSCFGGKPVPVVKIASNSLLFDSMADDMDFDAGVVLHGDSIEQTGERLLEQVLAHASGSPTCSERHGLGDHEFIPWTVGPTL